MSAPDRRVPLGRPLPDSDAALDERARVTPEDVEEAAAWWERHAPPKYRGLLESETEDEP